MMSVYQRRIWLSIEIDARAVGFLTNFSVALWVTWCWIYLLIGFGRIIPHGSDNHPLQTYNLTIPKTAWYPKFIFIYFDIHRNSAFGKLGLQRLRYPASIPPKPRSTQKPCLAYPAIKKVARIPGQYLAGFIKNHTPPTPQIWKRYPAASSN